MMNQKNTVPEPGEELKYQVGAVLVFIGHSPEELAATLDLPDGPYLSRFRVGDVLIVLPRNGCGLGIDVVRYPDGYPDMVWPEEVHVCP